MTLEEMLSNPDTWAQLSQSYGLGAPPAEGLPATLPGVQVAAPPQASLDSTRFTDFMNSIGGQIQNAYQYQTPEAQASLMALSQVPQQAANQMGVSPELQQLLAGQGYAPDILARMRATAVEGPAQAGLQQMAQAKRILGESGISGPAAAALQGQVSRETGYQQGMNLNQVEADNARQAMENQRFGVGQQTGIGMSNMQAANQMAMANANMMFQALQNNQQAQNAATAQNTQMQAQQGLAGASALSGFLGQQGAQWQSQANDREQQNIQNQTNAQRDQTQYDWQKQTMPWQELNNRYSQSQSILGSWGGQ